VWQVFPEIKGTLLWNGNFGKSSKKIFLSGMIFIIRETSLVPNTRVSLFTRSDSDLSRRDKAENFLAVGPQ